ncbi:MAG TPA: hypothetical protein VF064_16135 [Pyrinomonadaceae bacterium]
MPVIGRLGGQVEEVLITPLERLRRQDAGEPPPEDEPARGDATDSRGGHGERAARDEVGNDDVRDELPVWLL